MVNRPLITIMVNVPCMTGTLTTPQNTVRTKTERLRTLTFSTRDTRQG
nr:MAG TPA: hypothetical protein [Caudoviricetes sp.]